MTTAKKHTELSVAADDSARKVVDDAFDEACSKYFSAVLPRTYVSLMTMSPFELGMMFKKALRDELYDRRRSTENTVDRRKLN
ncbi:protein of unknown function [Pararobbsia alpina]|uniref:hypothetical protein n=1 Tax=Pararobbsia alpina TaxID=621374 RepID=UPI0039A64448